MDDNMAYIGRCKECNRVVMAVVDNPEHKKEVIADITEALKDGLAIERVSCDYVRSKDCEWKCKCP